MTRDEAIKAFRNSTPNPSSFSDEAWIDRFVALGMLKLDEPRGASFASLLVCARLECQMRGRCAWKCPEGAKPCDRS